MNEATDSMSNVFTETFANLFHTSTFQNEFIFEAVEPTTVSAEFGDSRVSKDFAMVSRLIAFHEARGVFSSSLCPDMTPTTKWQLP